MRQFYHSDRSHCWLLPACYSAFPPAPYYPLYGMVRDQVGRFKKLCKIVQFVLVELGRIA